jgi:malonyl-CoA O-methyltransferase
MDLKHGIRRNFARRAASYDRHAGVQRFMAQGLLTRLEALTPRVASILEIGCGTGYLTRQLRQAYPHARLVALDLAPALVAAARRRLGPNSGVAWLVADGEAWDRGRFDLIIANAAFQWLTCPGASLTAFGRSLNPGGVLAFSTLGPLTFLELSTALQRAAAALHLEAPAIAARGFLDGAGWTELLAQAGFLRRWVDREVVTTSFPSVRQFLKDLQATGATNPEPRPFAPRLFKGLVEAYRAGFGSNGSVPVTYELIWALARRE